MRRLEQSIQTDVLVIGGGFAGVTAALHATGEGASCAIAAGGPIFSGASFFPGTWGFGLIGPDGEADEDNLRDTILEVGCGMAEPTLVEKLVAGIQVGVKTLEGYGLELQRPQAKGEKTYIPCFDHKHRDWYGVRQPLAKAALAKQLTTRGVLQLDHTEIVALQKKDGEICGAIGIRESGFLQISCKSIVIACGGLSGLFRHAFGSTDCCGLGHLLALEAGARLVNIEFHQMMPGYVRPCPKTIYNEKVFGCSSFYDGQTGEELFGDMTPETRQSLLNCRAGHGPFTSRLPSREVDLRIFSRFLAREDGVILRYATEILTSPPEFVRTYFDWLKAEKGLTPEDEVRIGIFYHAANGGIAIDKNGFTGVPGLYACGEATGGMHGADRLGGLSTANALVFGRAAGENAAKAALKQSAFRDAPLPVLNRYPEPRKKTKWLKENNFAAMMLERSAENMEAALNRARELGAVPPLDAEETGGDPVGILDARRMEAAATVSQALLTAALLREESRGSHYRPDHPQQNSAMENRITVAMAPGTAPTAVWEPQSYGAS